jgi:hypothetical protein
VTLQPVASIRVTNVLQATDGFSRLSPPRPGPQDGDGVFKEVTEVQRGHRVALIPQDWVLIRKGHEDTDADRETTLWGHREETMATSQGQSGWEEPTFVLDLDSSL